MPAPGVDAMLLPVANRDQYLMIALLGALLGLAVLMLGGNASPPNVPVVLAGAPLFVAGAYGTISYWARGGFRE